MAEPENILNSIESWKEYLNPNKTKEKAGSRNSIIIQKQSITIQNQTVKFN